jgi:uncharacterized protein (TIGR03086 family)
MLTVLENATANTRRIVGAVRPEHYGLPTPCARFEVRDLLNHMVGGQQLMVQAPNAPVPPPPNGVFPDQIGDDPAGAFERSSKEVLDLFADPATLAATFHLGVDVPGDQALGIAVMEVVVHGWDLATAIGVPSGIDPALAEQLLAATQGFVSDQFRSPDGSPFGPALDAPEDAPAELRLMAFLGRRPLA